MSQQFSLSNRILPASVLVSTLGFGGAFVTGVLGFEEPNTALLIFSCTLALTAPVAVVVHLVMTRELTGEEKRLWIRELLGPRMASALSAYAKCTDRRSAAKILRNGRPASR